MSLRFRLMKAWPLLRLVPPVLSLLLWAGMTYCFLARPVRAAAITYLPCWIWVAPGLFLLILGRYRRLTRWHGLMVLLWAACLLTFMEEPRSLLRSHEWPQPEWTAAHRRGEAVRIITLNCGMGSVEAAEEVLPYQPDLVLLQEVPTQPEVEKLARKLYGKDAGVHWGIDQAILAWGTVTPAAVPGEFRTRFLQARVTLKNGLEAEVVSLHLDTPAVRLDLWNPDSWRKQAATLRRQMRQVRGIVHNLGGAPPALPLIVGGDFNAPAGDRVYRLFPDRLRDNFRDGGQGWGNTILNDTPVHRIDQVWTTKEFKAVSVVARKTRHSDHRMVICDFMIQP